MAYAIRVIVTTEDTRSEENSQKRRPAGSIIAVYTNTKKTRGYGFAPNAPMGIIDIADVPDIPFNVLARALTQPFYLTREVISVWRDIRLDLTQIPTSNARELTNVNKKQTILSWSEFRPALYVASKASYATDDDLANPRNNPT